MTLREKFDRRYVVDTTTGCWMVDCARKGRAAITMAKITAEAATEIRQRCLSGKETQKAVAAAAASSRSADALHLPRR